MKKAVLTAVALTAAISFSGCGLEPPKENPAETETEAEQIIPQTETETQTETESETETETEKQLSLKDIQVSIPKTNRTGNVKLQLEDSTGSKDIAHTFVATSTAFQSTDGEENGAYMDQSSVMYEAKGKWQLTDGNFQDIFNFVYADECEKKEDTTINDVPCYHIAYECDENIGILSAYCNMNGYTDIICGTTSLDYYVSKETKDILRVDITMSFAGTAADKTNITGEISGSMIVTGTTDENIVRPEPEKAEVDTAETAYTAGEIFSDNNSYQNQYFGIQVMGRELFYFDRDKTEELKITYQESGSKYQEEAYGNGDGIILNISSIPSKGASTEDVIQTYLTDSFAENVETGENITFADKNYATSTAIINATKTKTYATGVDGRVLLITLYYTDDASIDIFQKKNISKIGEDPTWEPASWVMEGKYQVTTPSGYTISQNDSGDLYTCMQSASDEINIFAIENSNLDTEIANETQTANGVTREIKIQEAVDLADGTQMQYYVVNNSEPNISYYTYIGLIQKDSAVIKFYVVSSADSADYKSIYTELANSTTVLTSETDAPAEAEEQTETQPE